MSTWNDVGLRWQTDKATIGPRAMLGHGYLDHYEAVLGDRRIASVCEIGVQSGGSLFMWSELFPGARVLGIDIDPDCALINGPFDLCIGDAGHPEAMAAHAQERFDLIVDDGSHHATETWRNLDVWAPRLADDGVYVIEDVVIGSTSWVQSLDSAVEALLAHGLTPFLVARSQMRWVAHDHYGGMMAIVFADRTCETPWPR